MNHNKTPAQTESVSDEIEMVMAEIGDLNATAAHVMAEIESGTDGSGGSALVHVAEAEAALNEMHPVEDDHFRTRSPEPLKGSVISGFTLHLPESDDDEEEGQP